MPQITQSDIFGDPSLWTPLDPYGGTPLGAYPATYGLGQTGYGQQGPSLGGQPAPYVGGAGGYQPGPYGGGAAGYQPRPFNPGALVGGGGGGQPQSFQDSGGGALTTGLGALSAASAINNLTGGQLGESARAFLGDIPIVSDIADLFGLGTSPYEYSVAQGEGALTGLGEFSGPSRAVMDAGPTVPSQFRSLEYTPHVPNVPTMTPSQLGSLEFTQPPVSGPTLLDAPMQALPRTMSTAVPLMGRPGSLPIPSPTLQFLGQTRAGQLFPGGQMFPPPSPDTIMTSGLTTEGILNPPTLPVSGPSFMEAPLTSTEGFGGGVPFDTEYLDALSQRGVGDVPSTIADMSSQVGTDRLLGSGGALDTQPTVPSAPGNFLGDFANARQQVLSGNLSNASLLGPSTPTSFGALPGAATDFGALPGAFTGSLGSWLGTIAPPIAAIMALPTIAGMGQSQNSAEAMRQGTAAAVGAFQNPNFGLSQAQRIGSLTGLPLPDYGQYGDPRTLETGANIGGIFNQLEQAGGRAALSPSAQSLYDDLRNYQVVLQERKNTAALERLGLPADVVRPDPRPIYSPIQEDSDRMGGYEGIQPYEDGGGVGGYALPVYRQIQPYDPRLLQQVMPSTQGQTYGSTLAGRLLSQGMSPSQVEEYVMNVGQ